MATVARVAWGVASAGLESFLLSNGRISATVINFGATLVSVKVPSRSSAEAEEVTLCPGSLEALRTATAYAGATCGRVGNRIARGAFTLDGIVHDKLAVNNGANHLHGGLRGWDKQFWAAVPWVRGDAAGVAFTLVSPAGDEGYPGTVTATAEYALDAAADALTMTFSATADAPTPINMCNHAYWNLSGGFRAGIASHTLRSPCTHYLPVDGGSIPTGDIAPVAGTPFDFSAETPIGARMLSVPGDEPGYDHCLARVGPGAWPAAGLGLGIVAVLRDPASGRAMEVLTTAPGVQLYSANYLSKDSKDAPFTQHNAACLETQNFPDAINRQGTFPDAVLRPGKPYKHVARHVFTW